MIKRKLTGMRGKKTGTKPIKVKRTNTKQPIKPVSLSLIRKKFKHGRPSYKQKVEKTIIGLSKGETSKKRIEQKVQLQLDRKENRIKKVGVKIVRGKKVKIWQDIKTGKQITGKK